MSLPLRFLIRILQESGSKQGFLSEIKALANATGAQAKNPKWTSYGALEIDIFAPTKSDFHLFTAAVEPLARIEFHTDLNQAPPHRTDAELFAEARVLFNSERYWECHEVLEGKWRTLSGEEKGLVQGIILVCAAQVHHQKGEEEVAISMLRRASKQLDTRLGVYHGIDTLAMRERVSEMISTGRSEAFTI